jgi:ADP-ribosylglycohydrolase
VTRSNRPAAEPVASLTIEQIHGALLGAAMGDALGWPYEQNAGRIGATKSDESPSLAFSAWWRRAGGRFQPHEEEIEAGGYSDDTQLILATARSLLRGDGWGRHLAFQEIPLWLSYERGGGGSTKRAAAVRRRGIWPWQDAKLHGSYFEAGGNGVAMRVLPHVLIQGQTENQLLRDVFRNGIITHGHPRALLGARLYAQAAWWIAHTPRPLPFGSVIEALLEIENIWGKPPENTDSTENTAIHWIESANKHFTRGYSIVWQEIVREIHDGLELCYRSLKEGALADDTVVLQQLRCFDRKVNGSGVIAALATIYLFAAHAADPMTGVRTIAFARSADTDTLASMLGGLFGLCHGLDWIPEPLRQVQDRELIAETANQLAHLHPFNSSLVTNHWSEHDEEDLKKQLLQEGIQHVLLGSLGDGRIVARKTLKSLVQNLKVYQWQIVTSNGQVLYIKHAQKLMTTQERTKKRETIHPKETQAQDEYVTESRQAELFTENTPAQISNDLQPSDLNRAGELLREAISGLSEDLLDKSFLTAISEALISAPLSLDMFDVLIQHHATLSEKQRHMYIYLLRKFLVTAYTNSTDAL